VLRLLAEWVDDWLVYEHRTQWLGGLLDSHPSVWVVLCVEVKQLIVAKDIYRY
jgi:hypothetical protein